MAPLDIAFTADGNTALIPFHGSCKSSKVRTCASFPRLAN